MATLSQLIGIGSTYRCIGSESNPSFRTVSSIGILPYTNYIGRGDDDFNIMMVPIRSFDKKPKTGIVTLHATMHCRDDTVLTYNWAITTSRSNESVYMSAIGSVSDNTQIGAGQFTIAYSGSGNADYDINFDCGDLPKDVALYLYMWRSVPDLGNVHVINTLTVSVEVPGETFVPTTKEFYDNANVTNATAKYIGYSNTTAHNYSLYAVFNISVPIKDPLLHLRGKYRKNTSGGSLFFYLTNVNKATNYTLKTETIDGEIAAFGDYVLATSTTKDMSDIVQFSGTLTSGTYYLYAWGKSSSIFYLNVADYLDDIVLEGEVSGMARIANGSSFDNYMVYINNGNNDADNNNNWDPYIPYIYIDDGSGSPWKPMA